MRLISCVNIITRSTHLGLWKAHAILLGMFLIWRLFVCLTSCFIVHASLSYTVDGILGTSPVETAANGMFVTQNVERLGLNPTEPWIASGTLPNEPSSIVYFNICVFCLYKYSVTSFSNVQAYSLLSVSRNI